MPQLFIDSVDDALSYERCESFGNGMDAYTRSTLLPQDAFQYSENMIIPDGMSVRTRPGADKLGEAFTGKIQGLIYFDTPTYEQLIAGNAGKIYSWSGTAPWVEMTGWTLNDSSLDLSSAQGVDTALFTDGVQELRYWNGTAWSAALGSSDMDPPKGATILLWHAGRMWAAGFSGATSGKENDALWGSNLLAFGSNEWNKTDRNIRIGGGDGDPIKAVESLSSSFDKGFVMAVLKANSIWLVNTPPNVPFVNFSANIGPEQVSDGIGCVGKRAFCVFGNDLLFVSPDKNIYSLARMESAQGQYKVSPPLSIPIQPYIDRINWTFANLITVVKYRELALFSVPLDSSTVPNTVLVWNGRLQRWVGVWTGWTPNSWEVTRFSDVHRLVHGDNVGNVRQWKEWKDATDDNTYLDDSTSISCSLWTRSMLFGEPLNNKDAFHCETRFNQSNAIVAVNLIADDATLKTWSADVRSTGPTLPITLPFDLENANNKPIRRGLRGLTSFNEAYITLSSTSGWFSVRNISLSAFLNTLANQDE